MFDLSRAGRLAMHLGFFLYIRRVRRKQRQDSDAFWRQPATAVWLGPLDFRPSDLHGEEKDVGSKDAIDEKDAKEEVKRQMGKYGEVTDVILWTADKAKKRIEEVAKYRKIEPVEYRFKSEFAVVVFARRRARPRQDVHRDALAVLAVVAHLADEVDVHCPAQRSVRFKELICARIPIANPRLRRLVSDQDRVGIFKREDILIT